MRYIIGPAVKTALRWVYTDLALMEEAVRESGLDWTVVRPPQRTGRRTGRTSRGVSVSRAGAAHLMLRLAEDPTTIGQVVGVPR